MATRNQIRQKLPFTDTKCKSASDTKNVQNDQKAK
jgi:hypothetical protein